MISKELLYFCKKCQSAKSTKTVIVFPEQSNGSRDKGQEVEIIKTFTSTITDGDKIVSKEHKARQLICGHFVSFYTPGFRDVQTDSLDELETAEIRRKIEMELIGLQAKELEKVLLFHVDQYQTLLKVSSKQLKQAKYGIQFLNQMIEEYLPLLNEEDQKTLKEKFAYFLDLRPTASNKTIERIQIKVDKEADKQKAALEAVRDLLNKRGYQGKELFGSSDPSKE